MNLRARRVEDAEDCVDVLPTIEEVLLAGYPASHRDMVKRERDAFIRRFNKDPAFAEEQRQRARSAAVDRSRR